MSQIKRGWTLVEQENVRKVWNSTKNRHETWVRTSPAHAWILVKADPIDINFDNFISPALTSFPALYGVSSQLQWWTTGRPNPTGANFAQVNELGGGLAIKTRGQTDRWVAVHYGDIYPFNMSLSPHIYLKSNIETITNIHAHAGLVGSVNKPSTGGAHTQPDDGIWVEIDTSIDNNFRSVTRVGGVQTSKVLGSVDSQHHKFCIRVSDAGDQVEFLVDGFLVQTHVAGENLPVGVMMQPYYEVMTRENAVKSVHAHTYLQLFDAQWI
jgi:hypothetical protein